MVKDIFPGVGGSFPQNLIDMHGKLYFVASEVSVYYLDKSSTAEKDTAKISLSYGGELWSLAYFMYLPRISQDLVPVN